MRFSKCFAAVIMVGLIAVSSSFAETKTVSYTTSTPVSYSPTNWVNNLVFQKFNQSLGTLYQVDLSITAGIQTTLTVTHVAGLDSYGNARTHMTVTVTDPLNLISVIPDIYSPAFNYSLAPGQQVTSGLLTRTGNELGSWTDSPILTEFTGNGNDTISLSAVTFTETVLANTGGNSSASQVTSASTTGTVTYHYLVPEPGSMAVFGSGLLGMLAFIRRRRS